MSTAGFLIASCGIAAQAIAQRPHLTLMNAALGHIEASDRFDDFRTRAPIRGGYCKVTRRPVSPGTLPLFHSFIVPGIFFNVICLAGTVAAYPASEDSKNAPSKGKSFHENSQLWQMQQLCFFLLILNEDNNSFIAAIVSVFTAVDLHCC